MPCDAESHGGRLAVGTVYSAKVVVGDQEPHGCHVTLEVLAESVGHPGKAARMLPGR